MAGVLLKPKDAILGESLAVLLEHQAPVFSEKGLLREWLAVKEYVCQVEQALLDANQKEANLLMFVQDLVLQESLLSQREREFFAAIARDQQNKEIARELHISERTVKFHVGVPLRMLGKRSRQELNL
jgi:DNA-binding NarL/FixJ family response regulator